MALKVLMLRKRMSEKQKELEALERAAEAFQTREAELEADIEAAQTEEERTVVEEAINAFETERNTNTEQQEALRGEISGMEAEIAKEEENTRGANPAARETEKERSAMNTAETRTRFFGMSVQQRDAFFADQEVKDFLQRTRELAAQKRSVSGAELLVPHAVLDLLREQVAENSKMLKHVALHQVAGTSRATIAGTVPEAVWTEMCAKLNELELVFNGVELDGYKVGGYVAICNATLEDSDIALASEIITALGRSIGLALDKAIIYGSGVKMPMGIVTRLAQSEQPSGYSAKARPWVNLSSSNIIQITAANSTGTKLFQGIISAAAAAKGTYATGGRWFAMNAATHAKLVAEGLGVNAAGALVAGVNATMPAVGGAIEDLEFIPDNNIITGWDGLYVLAERAGTRVESSEHVKFLDDQTVFKGTARYDGVPAIAEGFAAIGINAVAPTTSLTFAEDKAN